MPASPILLLLLAALALLACASALPLDTPEEMEALPLTQLSDGSKVYLLRDKRQQNFNRYPGAYPGAYNGYNQRGRPGHQGGHQGGFQGNRPGGGFQQGGFQQPSFSGGAANAQAQGFQGSNFGANHAGTQTQSFGAGPGGIQGSVGQGFSQNYNFPNGINIGVSGSGTAAVGPGGVSQGGSNAVTITGPNGQPIRG